MSNNPGHDVAKNSENWDNPITKEEDRLLYTRWVECGRPCYFKDPNIDRFLKYWREIRKETKPKAKDTAVDTAQRWLLRWHKKAYKAAKKSSRERVKAAKQTVVVSTWTFHEAKKSQPVYVPKGTFTVTKDGISCTHPDDALYISARMQ
jgi:hypothetical protein